MASVVPSDKSPTVQLYGLDLLRFLAAILVMVYHLTYDTWADPRLRRTDGGITFGVYRYLEQYTGSGWIGVQIFFVISGFVIAYSANGKDAWNYGASRFLRLVPGLWVCAIVSLPFLIVSGVPLSRMAISFVNTLLIQPFGPHVSSAFWTLPIEIAFYATMSLLIIIGKFQRIQTYGIVLGSISSLFWMLHVFLDDKLGLRHVVFGMNPATQLLLFQHGCFFALGILMWLGTQVGWNLIRMTGCACLMITGVVAIFGEVDKSYLWTSIRHSPLVPTTIWLGALVTIFISATYNIHVVRLIGNQKRIVKVLGLTTYPLYLIHQPVGIWLAYSCLKRGIEPLPSLIIASVASIGIAIWVATVLEPRLRGWMSSWLNHIRSKLPAESILFRKGKLVELG
ncbi:acyltransferase [Sphingomonas sp. NFX23]